MERDDLAVESELQIRSNKRGGTKLAPLHLGLLILSTVLLTLAGIFLVMGWNAVGIITMLLGIAVRVIDIRV